MPLAFIPQRMLAEATDKRHLTQLGLRRELSFRKTLCKRRTGQTSSSGEAPHSRHFLSLTDEAYSAHTATKAAALTSHGHLFRSTSHVRLAPALQGHNPAALKRNAHMLDPPARRKKCLSPPSTPLNKIKTAWLGIFS